MELLGRVTVYGCLALLSLLALAVTVIAVGMAWEWIDSWWHRR